MLLREVTNPTLIKGHIYETDLSQYSVNNNHYIRLARLTQEPDRC